jgi:predicted metalloendopeptidase
VKRFILSTITLSVMAACAHAAGHEGHDHSPAPAPTSGIETQYIDKSVRAQDDFFEHLNGGWLKTTEIPADKSSWGSFAKLRDDTLFQLRDLIQDLQSQKGLKGDDAKIAALYASYMDEAKLEKLGTKPLAGELSRIRGLKDKKGIPGLIAHFNKTGVPAPYGVGVSQDARNSTQYAAYMGQSGLGLPDREYYLKKDDAKMADALAKYELHVARILGLAGNKDGAEKAKAIVALETELAKVQWSRVDNRDPVKRYNKMEISKLAEIAPGYDWKVALGATGIAAKTDSVVVAQPSYMTEFAKLVDSTALETWKAYFEWQLLRDASPYLSKDFDQANFAFYGTVLTGVTEQQPRWKRGVGVVENAIGEGMGKLYVAKHFPAERKARMEELVKNLLVAYKQSIDSIDWMGADTKKQAQDKLAKFTPKIGYPNKWRDYSKLNFTSGDLIGNLGRASEFAYNRNLEKLGKPIDKEEWGMTPQTINAYYRPTANEIVFPAAILQPPFFDMKADDAVNYGAIGAVIGHEISHGFDDSGSQYDGDGNLRDWWTKEDRAAFKVKADAMVKQYGSYEPVPGYAINGKLTLGENIADNSGLAIAYKAYKISLGGKASPVIDGLSGEQRVFMGFGQVWRTKMREQQAIVQIKTDPHSAGRFRANGTVVNQPAFYEAFGVKEGDKMYVKPEDRIIIW